MARKRGQKALYEAIGRANSSASQSDTFEGVSEQSATSYPVKQERIDWKPKVVQFNYERIELTLPYTWASGIVLLVVMVVLVAFRLGQLSSAGRPVVSLAVFDGNESTPTLEETDTLIGSDGGLDIASEKESEVVITDPHIEMPVEFGNAILIQAYHQKKDLVPVQKYFRKYNIDTELVKIDKTFYLATSERFTKFRNVPENRIYTVIKRIADIGKGYKATPPLDSFAPHRFSDAYPITFDEQFKGDVVNVN
jgi:hypothetical protein